jgi:hypothetical protein
MLPRYILYPEYAPTGPPDQFRIHHRRTAIGSCTDTNDVRDHPKVATRTEIHTVQYSSMAARWAGRMSRYTKSLISSKMTSLNPVL